MKAALRRARAPVDAAAAAPETERLRARDLRLVPLAASGWSAAWLGTWGTAAAWAIAGVAAVVVLVVAVLRRSSSLVAVAAVLVGLTVVGGATATHLRTGPLAQLAQQQAVARVVLQVSSDPQHHAAKGAQPPYITLRGQVLAVHGRGSSWRLRQPVLVVAGGGAAEAWKSVVVGSRQSVSGRLEAPERGDDLAALLRVREAGTAVRAPPGGLRWVERVRQGLRDAVRTRPPEPRALVPALVLGDTSGMTGDLTADFQSTGLTHLTAVSGANLTLLLAFLLLAGRWVGVRGWGLRLLGLLGVAVFVALCRTEPSVLRAAAMGLVALAALGAGGRRAGLRNLSVAMLALLLADPFLSRSVGFALSVLASAGIICWGRGWSAILRRWLPQVVAESVAVALAAHLSTLPLVAAISGRVSVSGLVANALAGPVVGPATVLGFAAAGASLVSPGVAWLLGFGASWCAQLIIWVAQVGAGLTGSAWQWPTTPAALVWLGVVALGVALLLPYVFARRGLSLLLAAVMVGCLGLPTPHPGWPPPDWLLVACDIGQGDGLALRVAPRAAVVIDSGPDPDAMRRCLDGLGVRDVPLLVLTHFHADHVDGLAGVFAGRRVGQIWVSPLASPAYEATRVHEFADRHGSPTSTPGLGTRATVGAATLLVLGPVPHLTSAEDESSVQNDASLVLMATVDGVRLLLSGDVEPLGQQAILAAGADLRADVLKVPHHGSARQEREFFAATQAQLAVVSAGLHNDYGHPAPGTVRLVGSLGMTLLRTDTEGGVAVALRDGDLRAVTQYQGRS